MEQPADEGAKNPSTCNPAINLKCGSSQMTWKTQLCEPVNLYSGETEKERAKQPKTFARAGNILAFPALALHMHLNLRFTPWPREPTPC